MIQRNRVQVMWKVDYITICYANTTHSFQWYRHEMRYEIYLYTTVIHILSSRFISLITWVSHLADQKTKRITSWRLIMTTRVWGQMLLTTLVRLYICQEQNIKDFTKNVSLPIQPLHPGPNDVPQTKRDFQCKKDHAMVQIQPTVWPSFRKQTWYLNYALMK